MLNAKSCHCCVVPTDGDNTDGLTSQLSSILFETLRNTFIYPMVDISDPWLRPENASGILRVGSQVELKMLELYPWEEGLQADEQLSRFSFAGLAAYRLERVGPVVDGRVQNNNEGIAYKNEWCVGCSG